MPRTPLILRHSIAALLLTVGIAPVKAATFTWNNGTGNWSVGTNWSGNVAPAGTNVADVLVFGGDVGITPGVSPNYTSTNNLAVSPFLLNAVTMNATNVNGQPSDPPQIVAGTTPLFLTGVSPTFTQNGAGAVTLNIPIRLNGGLTVGGTES